MFPVFYQLGSIWLAFCMLKQMPKKNYSPKNLGAIKLNSSKPVNTLTLVSKTPA